MIFQARIDFTNRLSAPDDYEHKNGGPSPNFVVSRTSSGDVASRLGDRVWDWTAYSASGRKQFLRFDTWCENLEPTAQDSYVQEMQTILFSLIWLCAGPLISFSTIARYLYALNKIALTASARRESIEAVLASRNALSQFLDENGDYYSGALARILALLGKVRSDVSGIRVLSRKDCNFIAKRHARYVELMEQTAPIPTRIYTTLLCQLTETMDMFESVSPRFLKVVEICGSDPLAGRALTAQRERAGGAIEFSKIQTRPTLAELSVKHDLGNFLNTFGSKNTGVKALGTALHQVQIASALLITAYTGMRIDEVRNLPFDCLEQKKSSGVTHNQIRGFTTKNNGGRRKTAKWITSREGSRAVRIAQSIARSIYKCRGIRVSKKLGIEEHLPLFLSPVYLGFTGSRNSVTKRTKDHLACRLYGASYKAYVSRLMPRIEREDVQELELVDPHRDWQNDSKFQVGSKWSLALLQFRRSFGLYATNSGYVSSPSLRRQLQHLTQEASLYYARGSERAAKLISSGDHPGKHYQEAQAESETLAFIKQCLMSDEKLFGGFGQQIDRISIDDQKVSISRDKYDRTLERAKRGELSYTETVLGGCAEPGPCDKKALRSVVGCISCANSIIKKSKLDTVIAAQESLVDSLAEGSVEWRIEKDDLSQLLNLGRRLEKRNANVNR